MLLSKAGTIRVPAAPLEFRALAGLETELAIERVDLTGKSHARLQIPLARFYQARRKGYLATKADPVRSLRAE
jgi:hypothetical protein